MLESDHRSMNVEYSKAGTGDVRTTLEVVLNKTYILYPPWFSLSMKTYK